MNIIIWFKQKIWEFKNGTYSTISNLNDNPFFFRKIEYAQTLDSGVGKNRCYSEKHLNKIISLDSQNYVVINLQMW